MNLQYFRNLTTVFILVQSLLFSQESSSLKNHELEFIYFEPSLAFTTNYSGALKLTHMHILGIQLEDSEDFIRTDKLYGGYFDNSMINAMEINGADIAKFYNKIDKSFFSSKLSKTFSNLSLCKYRDTNYVFLDDVIITDIYNSDRMSNEEQIASATRKFSFDLIKLVDNTFRGIDVLSGYIVVISIISKPFLDEYARLNSQIVMYICDKLDVSKLKSYEITEQEFLDNILIISKTGGQGENRIKIKL